MEVGNNVQLVYRPSIDYRDVFLTYWKKDSKPYVFLLPIPDSSRAVGETNTASEESIGIGR